MANSASGGASVAIPGHPAAQHNGFLDLIRTVAILRVLVWHTYGYAWISYLVASMPAMFFVAGSLMAHSLNKSGVLHVLYSRFRRLLVPLWLFAVVALAIMISHAQIRPGPGEALDYPRLVFWAFPVWDPQGCEWGVTWWAVLWYLRCMTWLILLSPLLIWLFRRLSIVLLGLPLGLVVAFEYFRRAGDPVPWQVEDVAVFGFFWLLGFAYDARMFDSLKPAVRAAAALVFAAGAAAWMLTQDVPGGVVNASYPAHLLVGLAWLFAALAFERPLMTFSARHWPAAVIAWVNDRVFTIYLWHAAGLFAMYQILWVSDHPRWLRDAAALPIVVAVTFACMLAFGWVEDIAARREIHLAPRAGLPGRPHERAPHPRFREPWPLALGAAIGVAALFAAVLVDVLRPPGETTVASAIPPSGVGLSIRASSARILERPPEPEKPVADTSPVAASEIQQLLERWVAANQLPGATLSVRRPDGSEWTGSTGVDAETPGPLTPDHVYWTASVTKTFTTALILQLRDEGKLGLDDPVSRYVPGIAHSSEVTIRELIQHTSGLMATDGVPPDKALLAATSTPLAFLPGTGFLYSAPAYYMLGLVIEKVTGKTYTHALHERLLDPLGLSASHMDEELDPLPYSTHPAASPALRSSSGVMRSSSGRVAVTSAFEYRGVLWSAGGLYSDVSDLTRWALALYDGDTVVSAATRDEMTRFLPVEQQYAGLGTYPFCPCWYENGRLMGDRWGHYGRSGVLEYDPQDRVALAVFTSGTDIDERLIVAYDDLSKQLRDLLRGRPFESTPEPKRSAALPGARPAAP